jgi:hypothetical protein
MRNELESIAREAWAQPVKTTPIKFQKKVASQKIARHKRDMSEKNSKSLPVFFNRNQAALAIGVNVRRFYEKNISAQAFDAKGAPLFRADRLESIAQLLRKPEVVA